MKAQFRECPRLAFESQNIQKYEPLYSGSIMSGISVDASRVFPSIKHESFPFTRYRYSLLRNDFSRIYDVLQTSEYMKYKVNGSI